MVPVLSIKQSVIILKSSIGFEEFLRKNEFLVRSLQSFLIKKVKYDDFSSIFIVPVSTKDWLSYLVIGVAIFKV